MKKQTLYNNFAVIADDFTGSNDTGVQFAKKGFTTSVINFTNDNNNQENIKSDIIVLNTDSRLISKEEASKRISEVSKKFKNTISKFYKKIDSTFRGNVGVEIETLLTELDRNICVLAPALPNLKRTTKNGKCFVDKVELHETAFSKDPITPVTTSSIKDILNIQSNYDIKLVTIEDIYSSDFENLFLDQMQNNEKTIFICDSTTNEDLLSIADIVSPYLDKIVCAGSAGFADALSSKSSFIPILFVSGSVSPNSLDQLNYIDNNNDFELLDIEKDLFFSSSMEELMDNINIQIYEAIKNKKHIVLSLTKSKDDIENNKKFSQKYSIDENEIHKHIALNLALIASNLLNSIKVRALFINGGDTAIKIMETIEGNQVSILGEISIGVPHGNISYGKYAGLALATKAGGFGDKTTLLSILDFYS